MIFCKTLSDVWVLTCLAWWFGRFVTILEWQEREHEKDDALALGDNIMVNAL